MLPHLKKAIRFSSFLLHTATENRKPQCLDSKGRNPLVLNRTQTWGLVMKSAMLRTKSKTGSSAARANAASPGSGQREGGDVGLSRRPTPRPVKFGNLRGWCPGPLAPAREPGLHQYLSRDLGQINIGGLEAQGPLCFCQFVYHILPCVRHTFLS